ncbi:hypothetical protein C8R45DRAFT_942870 [Mycena sanguinolenta]|nr:hypothetical protein C8R45DRAFT_942870 [Mycena sanguinolenta]
MSSCGIAVPVPCSAFVGDVHINFASAVQGLLLKLSHTSAGMCDCDLTMHGDPGKYLLLPHQSANGHRDTGDGVHKGRELVDPFQYIQNNITYCTISINSSPRTCTNVQNKLQNGPKYSKYSIFCFGTVWKLKWRDFVAVGTLFEVSRPRACFSTGFFRRNSVFSVKNARECFKTVGNASPNGRIFSDVPPDPTDLCIPNTSKSASSSVALVSEFQITKMYAKWTHQTEAEVRVKSEILVTGYGCPESYVAEIDPQSHQTAGGHAHTEPPQYSEVVERSWLEVAPTSPTANGRNC